MASKSRILDTPLSVLCAGRDKALIEVRSDTSVEDVLRLMKQYDIISMPIRGAAADTASTPGNPNELVQVGIVSLVDIGTRGPCGP